jgi:phenylpropionate dioxygenase-like ring-hydroxylating dioxygenase large terminal subunit
MLQEHDRIIEIYEWEWGIPVENMIKISHLPICHRGILYQSNYTETATEPWPKSTNIKVPDVSSINFL